ncbi:MAG TPA: AAA family ATPase, partial [Actinoplanes sp.]
MVAAPFSAPVEIVSQDREGSAFEVLGEIGRGAEAVVHRVRRDGAEYAMKVLQPTGTAHDTVLRRLQRTVALLASVSDPGLARVHEVGVFDGRPYLLMELVEGRRLTDVLADGPMAEPDLVKVGLGLTGALIAVHRCGLVHRDLKPDNVLLEPGGSARLIDFGLADRVARETGAEVVGTLAYTAPERTGMLHRTADGRADLYSLGVLLFECATGSAPYVSGDVGELLRAHAMAPVPDPRVAAPDLSPALAGIIRRLLAKDPDDRYQSGTGLLADLRRAAEAPGLADFPLGTSDELAAVDQVPFVGRERELATLDERWRAARRGRGGVVLVEGAPGGGKSRLVQQFTAGVLRTGHLVLDGRCAPDNAQPLAALRTAVEAHLRAVRRLPAAKSTAALALVREAAGEAAPLLQTLSAALGEVLTAGEQVSDMSQDGYLGAVTEFLLELARRSGGAVLAVDDVQWCDEATGRVLERLAAAVAGTPLLVVVAARDDADLTGFTRGLGDGLTATVEVEPLDAAATAALVAATNGGLPISDDVSARLAARSHGNAFTLLEYVKEIVDAGLVRVGAGKWSIDVGHLDALELPVDTAELVLKRVAALDADNRRILGLAAVVGYRFTADLVAGLAHGGEHRPEPVEPGATDRQT